MWIGSASPTALPQLLIFFCVGGFQAILPSTGQFLTLGKHPSPRVRVILLEVSQMHMIGMGQEIWDCSLFPVKFNSIVKNWGVHWIRFAGKMQRTEIPLCIIHTRSQLQSLSILSS